MMRRIAAGAVAAGALAFAASGAAPAGTGDGLAVRVGDRWVTWWERAAAPERWEAGAPLADRIAWHSGADGIEWGELALSGASEAWRTRVVVARLDPRRAELSLDPAFTSNREWTVDDAAERRGARVRRGSVPRLAPLGLGSDRRHRRF